MKQLVFVHGFMGDPSDWDFIQSQLADEFEITLPHIRPAADWKAGVKQLADEIPDDSILVGYSMGARLSLGVAFAHPQKVKALVFCSGNPGMEDDELKGKRYDNDLAIAHEIETTDRRDFLHRWYTESTVFRSLSDQVRDDEIRRKGARTGDDWSSVLRAYSVAKQPNYWTRLSELSIPVLAIAGAEDRKYSKFIARMGELSNFDARVVAACGHIVHREQPHVFLQLLKEFVAA